jgi:hypothetical protein
MISAPATLAAALGIAADKEINRALAGGGAITAKPSDEVSAVAAVTLDALPSIGAVWRTLLPRVSLSMTGVFCHGSPQVDFTHRTGEPGRCELADLLVVVDEVDAARNIKDRRANLIQAKMIKGGSITTDLDQHELLTVWPSFNFVSSAYARNARAFSAVGAPGFSDESGSYGAIALTPFVQAWRQSEPLNFNSPFASLGSYMASMLTGVAGYGRQATAGGSDDWSATIDELLTVTAGQTFSHTASLGPKNPKMRGVTALMALSDSAGVSTYAFDPPVFDGPPDERPGRDGGISIIYVAATQTEPSERRG